MTPKEREALIAAMRETGENLKQAAELAARAMNLFVDAWRKAAREAEAEIRKARAAEDDLPPRDPDEITETGLGDEGQYLFDKG